MEALEPNRLVCTSYCQWYNFCITILFQLLEPGWSGCLWSTDTLKWIFWLLSNAIDHKCDNLPVKQYKFVNSFCLLNILASQCWFANFNKIYSCQYLIFYDRWYVAYLICWYLQLFAHPCTNVLIFNHCSSDAWWGQAAH